MRQVHTLHIANYTCVYVCVFAFIFVTHWKLFHPLSTSQKCVCVYVLESVFSVSSVCFIQEQPVSMVSTFWSKFPGEPFFFFFFLGHFTFFWLLWSFCPTPYVKTKSEKKKLLSCLILGPTCKFFGVIVCFFANDCSILH